MLAHWNVQLTFPSSARLGRVCQLFCDGVVQGALWKRQGWAQMDDLRAKLENLRVSRASPPLATCPGRVPNSCEVPLARLCGQRRLPSSLLQLTRHHSGTSRFGRAWRMIKMWHYSVVPQKHLTLAWPRAYALSVRAVGALGALWMRCHIKHVTRLGHPLAWLCSGAAGPGEVAWARRWLGPAAARAHPVP